MRLAYKHTTRPSFHVRGVMPPATHLCNKPWDKLWARVYSGSHVLTQVQNNVRTGGFWAANTNTLALPQALKVVARRSV